MIDTVKLIIPREQYQVLEPERFNPPFYNSGFNIKHILNSKNRDLHFTIIRRKLRGGINTPLYIEFSAPKLIFKNNIDELEDNDFEKIIKMLHDRTREEGIFIGKGDLENATFQSIHFSKNIPLDNYLTPSMIINALMKIDIPKRFDLTREQFKNNGLSLSIYSKIHSLVIYDKIKDIIHPKTRAIDKNKTIEEKNIYNLVKETKKPLEILRIEVRLCNRKKIKEVFSKVNFKSDITFRNIFDKALSQKILLFYWKTFIIKNSDIIEFIQMNSADLLTEILNKNNGKRLTANCAKVGMISVVKEVGMKGLRNIIENSYSSKAWERTKKELESLNSTNSISDLDYGKYILRKINEFKTVRLFDLGLSNGK